MLLINLAISLFSMLKVKTLECVSVINEKCMSKPKILYINPNELVFYPLSIKVNKCSGDCNNINDPIAKLCVTNIVKNMNIKVFNLLARINETRKIVWHETCKYVCRLTSAICNDRQERNENKCRCECKEDLVSKLVCDKGYMWNLSTCCCECDRYCETGQYLDYKNCVCRKKIIDDLIEQCTSIVDMDIKNNTFSKKSDESSSNIYFVLFIIFLVLFVLFLVVFIYYWCKNNKAIIKDVQRYLFKYKNAKLLKLCKQL